MSAGLPRKPDQCRVAAGGPWRSVRPPGTGRASGRGPLETRRAPGLVLDPARKQPIRVVCARRRESVRRYPAMRSPGIATPAWRSRTSSSRYRLVRMRTSFLEMDQPCHQQRLAVVGHRREPVVDLIAKHVARVMKADRDQGAGRERDQNAHEERQLDHDRSPRSQAWSSASGSSEQGCSVEDECPCRRVSRDVTRWELGDSAGRCSHREPESAPRVAPCCAPGWVAGERPPLSRSSSRAGACP